MSLKEELNYSIDEIEGEISIDLNGTLYCNGPGLLDINGDRFNHPFDGDGMICAIAFHNGGAHFCNRFVRTKGFSQERETGKILYRRAFGTQKSGGWQNNAFDFHLKNVANTNVVDFGDRLLALWEAGNPYRLDFNTLETLGMDTLNGILPQRTPFADRPMKDPGDEHRPTRLVTFGLKSAPFSNITIYEFDPAGQLVKKHDHWIPGFAFIHDFAITPNYYIFFQIPIFLNPFPFIFGQRGTVQCIHFLSSQPMKIWAIPRDESKAVKVFKTDPFFVFHNANAFERGDEIIVDATCYDGFPATAPNGDYLDANFDKVPPGQLWRFHLNLNAEIADRHSIDPPSIEFPFVHPARIGSRHRWIYLVAAHEPEGNGPKQAILKIDPETGEREIWSAAPKGFVGEPVFVPRSHATAEDEGWVLSLIYDAAHHRSDVAIFDATQIAQGPIALLHLKHHIPAGLHGSFCSLD